MADVKATDNEVKPDNTPLPANAHEAFLVRPHEVEAMEAAKGAAHQAKIAEKTRADLDRSLTTIIPDEQKVSDAKDIPNQTADVIQDPALSPLKPKETVEMERTDPETDKEVEELGTKAVEEAKKTVQTIEKEQQKADKSENPPPARKAVEKVEGERKAGEKK